MQFKLPKGWERDSDTAYIHTSGVTIRLMTYREREGWMLVPASLDQAVIPFDPTPEGRDQAFEAFAKGALDRRGKDGSEKPARKTRVTRRRAAEAKESKETEESEEPGSDEDADDDDDNETA